MVLMHEWDFSLRLRQETFRRRRRNSSRAPSWACAGITCLGSETSDLRFQIFAYFRSQISDFRSQISDFRSQISDLRFQIADLRFQISDVRFQISEFRLSQMSDLRSQMSPLESEFEIESENLESEIW